MINQFKFVSMYCNRNQAYSLNIFQYFQTKVGPDMSDPLKKTKEHFHGKTRIVVFITFSKYIFQVEN